MEENKTTQPAPLYIVTGATDSMGSVIARRLAKQGKPLLLASRDIAKAERFADKLRTETRNKDIQCLQLDLSSFDLVNDFVVRLKALDRPVYALVNNAGTLPRHSRISPDGYEHTVQVNFLSTALLSLLVPLLVVRLLPGESFVRFLLVSVVCVACTSLVIYFVGCSDDERTFVKNKTRQLRKQLFSR